MGTLWGWRVPEGLCFGPLWSHGPHPHSCPGPWGTSQSACSHPGCPGAAAGPRRPWRKGCQGSERMRAPCLGAFGVRCGPLLAHGSELEWGWRYGAAVLSSGPLAGSLGTNSAYDEHPLHACQSEPCPYHPAPVPRSPLLSTFIAPL